MKQKPHPWMVQSMCQGKEAMDRKRAVSVAKRMSRNGRFLHHYRCKVCHKWHVGKAGK